MQAQRVNAAASKLEALGTGGVYNPKKTYTAFGEAESDRVARGSIRACGEKSTGAVLQRVVQSRPVGTGGAASPKRAVALFLPARRNRIRSM